MKKRLKVRGPRSTPRRGFYLLPNLLTTASLFCGFYSIMAAIGADFEKAALAILASFFFDGLDGRIARATRTTSHFGVEYDSLSDVVAFGVAPAVLAFLWVAEDLGRIGWLAAFLFLACGALRLARFNTLAHKGSMAHFKGLPIPAAAAVVATMVLLAKSVGPEERAIQIAVVGSLYVLSFLMVSNIPYQSFKNAELVRQRPFQALVLCVLVLVVVLANPPVTLFLFSIAYALSGPIAMARRALRRGSVSLNRETPEISKEEVL